MLSIKLEEFIDTRSLDKLAELYEVMNEEKLSVKDTGVAYRIINHWDEKGLIRCGRVSEEAHRRFSFIDFMWIKIVEELRSFGISIPVIKKITDEMFLSFPINDIFDVFAENLDALKGMEAEDKEGFFNFLKSGEYKSEDFSAFASEIKFSYLQLLLAESIATRNSVTLIVFNDGEWFPFVKHNEHFYPKEILYKKEFSSQIRVNITELVFRFILEDYFIELINGLRLFTQQERRLLYYIKEGDYKKVFVLFKSKKFDAREIVKSDTAQEEIMHILREKEYKEFILTDKNGKEFRIREEDENKATGSNVTNTTTTKNDAANETPDEFKTRTSYKQRKRRRDAIKRANSKQ